MAAEEDLVLRPNEYAYVLDKTKGAIATIVGPYKMGLSASDELAIFDEKSKKFVRADFPTAIKRWVTAPENWYIALKNPVAESVKKIHPTEGTNNAPEPLDIGRKMNITGPVSFALYPGQMAKVIQGHRLRSNQYLIVRVYDASIDTANAAVSDEEDGDTQLDLNTSAVGQLSIIKGTDVSFYIPPTGIEVVPDGKGTYVREAVTLERLEYCILKDENGEKRFIHGPNVVFPEPTEEFVKNKDGGFKFKAIELSPISGIYVKVIAPYTENGKNYEVGEELFITGNDTMIYYPRAEHAIILYGDKKVHHAIAIPAGEGRYVLDRNTGQISTVAGPAMFLPDPRTQVIVQRKLSEKECKLWYPGNEEVLKINAQLDQKEDIIEKIKNTDYAFDQPTNEATICCSYDSLRANSISFKNGSGFTTTSASLSKAVDGLSEDSNRVGRGTVYSKPRTLMLNNKYDGVVNLNIWTGYAVNVINKDGSRKVLIGPINYMLDYSETLETFKVSKGRPKNDNDTITDVYLRTKNNRVTDVVTVETADYVTCKVQVVYNINFVDEYKDRWFNIENYVQFICDRMRTKIKRVVKEFNIEEFYNKYEQIISELASEPIFFDENGTEITSIDISGIGVTGDMRDLLIDAQLESVKTGLRLSSSKKQLDLEKELHRIQSELAEMKTAERMEKIENEALISKTELEQKAELNRQKETEKELQTKAEYHQAQQQSEIAALRREEDAKKFEQEHTQALSKAELETAMLKERAASLKSTLKSLSPQLVTAMNDKATAEMVSTMFESIAPYALASDKDVVDVATQLCKDSGIEQLNSLIGSFIRKD